VQIGLIIVTSLGISTRTVSVVHASCVMEAVYRMRCCWFIWYRRIRKHIPNFICRSYLEWDASWCLTMNGCTCKKSSECWLAWVCTSHVTCAGSGLLWPQPCVFSLNFTELHSVKAVNKYLNMSCMTLITLCLFCSVE